MLLHFAPGARKSPSRVGAASPPSCWPRERGSEAMVSRSSAPLLVRTRRRACSFVASDDGRDAQCAAGGARPERRSALCA